MGRRGAGQKQRRNPLASRKFHPSPTTTTSSSSYRARSMAPWKLKLFSTRVICIALLFRILYSTPWALPSMTFTLFESK